MSWKIPLFKIYSDEDDIKAVSDVVRRGTYWADGKEIVQFEAEIANYVGRKYALAFNSGTSALHVLIEAHGLKNVDIIVPSFTFIATANSVLLADNNTVFADSETDTFGLDVNDVKNRITENTKAVIALHYGGMVSRDIEAIKKLCDEKGLLLIEDAAESFGASLGGKKAGLFGESAIFSFCQNKVLPTGEGGMIVTDNRGVYDKAKLLRAHGRSGQDYFSSTEDNDYLQAGYNLRMSTITAALGLSQFKKISKLIEIRRNNAKYLSQRIKDVVEITVPIDVDDMHNVYQMYTIKLDTKQSRDKLQKHLADAGVMTKVYFQPVHEKTAFAGKLDLPNCNKLSETVLTLPIYPTLKQEELDLIVDEVKRCFNE